MPLHGLFVVCMCLCGTDAGSSPPPSALALGAQAVPIPVASPEVQRFHESGSLLWVALQIWGLALPGVVLVSGLAARMDRAALRLTGGRWLPAVWIFCAVYLLLSALAGFPLSYYASFVRPHAYGLSNQTLGRFLGHYVTDVAVTIVIWLVGVSVLYTCIRRSPRRWWLWAGVLSIPCAVVGVWLAPVVLDPLYNEFRALSEPQVERRIRDVAVRAGIGDAAIFEVDKSRDTRALNAYVTGLGGTHRIVVWDTLLAELDDDETCAVVAHEAGHYVLWHVPRGVAITAVLTLLGLAMVRLGALAVVTRWGARMGCTRLDQPASLPLLIVCGQIVALCLLPLGMLASRAMEREADRYALNLIGQPRAAATAFVKLQARNLSHPNPSWLYRLWRGSHPSLAERIGRCNERLGVRGETARPPAGTSGPPNPRPPSPALRDTRTASAVAGA